MLRLQNFSRERLIQVGVGLNLYSKRISWSALTSCSAGCCGPFWGTNWLKRGGDGCNLKLGRRQEEAFAPLRPLEIGRSGRTRLSCKKQSGRLVEVFLYTPPYGPARRRRHVVQQLQRPSWTRCDDAHWLRPRSSEGTTISTKCPQGEDGGVVAPADGLSTERSSEPWGTGETGAENSCCCGCAELWGEAILSSSSTLSARATRHWLVVGRISVDFRFRDNVGRASTCGAERLLRLVFCSTPMLRGVSGLGSCCPSSWCPSSNDTFLGGARNANLMLLLLLLP